MMKRVLVTGSSRGIGKAIALRLAEDGFAVVTHARGNGEAARAVAEACAARAGQPLQAPPVFDVADRDSAARMLEADMQANGVYYGVVANAGIHEDAPFPLLEGDMWDRVLNTDLTGLYNVFKPVVMPMVSARIRGRLVALSSVSGLAGNRGQVNYSAAKAGINGAVKALAVELARRGITVNAVAPGVIETDMAASIEEPELVKKAIPMRRFGRPEEVAGVVAFLMREEAAYVTRQVISVNGGLC
jgi:3-oxoacyl-[acyl-carrier protein] reductase